LATFRKLAKDAPPDCKGTLVATRSAFVFPNGAYIFIFGGNTEADADAARGGEDPIATFFDEGGYIKHLRYIYTSIAKPGMRLVQRKGHYGMIFVSSSTPKDLKHFFVQLADLARAKGAYTKKTIYDSDDPERYIADEAEDAGLTVEQFMETDTFRREFLCERIIDMEAAVFPEWGKAQMRAVREWPRPLGFERYIYKRTAVDPGMGDKTGFLYGYVDFTEAKIIVEDEALLTKPNTEAIAREIKEHEMRLWGETEERRISRRIDDPHGRLVLDLWTLHHIRIEKAIKHDRDASIGMIRTYMTNGKLVVHPRCVELRQQLLTATKNSTGRDYAEDEEGHFDLCAALQYFVRDLSLTTNPLPEDIDVLTGRRLPDNHPLIARQEAMGRPRRGQGLAAAILSGNRYVANQLRRRTR
jgi:hypothetical protein